MHKTTMRRQKSSRAGMWSVAVLLAFAMLLTPGTSLEGQASAAGEVITVEPGVAARGDFLTVTVSRISSSTFCSYLPFAGDGYYMRVYLYDYDNNTNYHQFPQTSELFNPSTKQSVTLQVGPIPSSYPLGRISVVGDCMYPDGRQTGNTAIPFSLNIVEAGQTAPAPDPAPPPAQQNPSPAISQPESDPAVANESADAASTGTPSAQAPRDAPQVPHSLSFSLRQQQEGPSSSLHVEGYAPESASRIDVYLVGASTEISLLSLTVTDGWFAEVVSIPETTQPGEYTLRAVAERGCPPGSTCRLSTEAAISVTSGSFEVLGETVTRRQDSVASAGGAILWAVSLIGAILVALSAGWNRWQKTKPVNQRNS